LTPFHRPFYLLKLSSAGDVLASIGIDDTDFTASDFVVNEIGNIYLSGEVEGNAIGGVQKNGFIAKFNDEFELQWSRRLYAENYDCNYVRVKSTPDGGVVFYR